MSKTIETVVIGTSLTEASDLVVQNGFALARAAGARVYLVHAYAPPMTYTGAPYFPEAALGEVYAAERIALRRQMDSQVRRLDIDPADLAGVVLDVGPAQRLLIVVAGKKDADLIVVGASEAPRLGRVFGSTADRVLRKATCPVLVVREEIVLPPQRVLLPVDLSPLSGEAFERGLALLEEIAAESGAAPPALEALFVTADFCRQHALARLSPTEGEIFSERDLRRFLAAHQRNGWDVQPRVTTGTVEAEILDRSEEWHPDLVILGTHGRGGFERFLLGSVAATLVSEGQSNTLVIPPRAAREAAHAAEMPKAMAV